MVGGVLNFDIETTDASMLSTYRIGCCTVGDNFTGGVDCPLRMAAVLSTHIDEGGYIAGHKIIDFDLPKLMYEEIKARGYSDLYMSLRKKPHAMLDTYIASRILRGRVGINSMQAWVDYLKEDKDFADRVKDKVEVPDFSTASDELLDERVTTDVYNQEAITDWFLDYYGEGFEDCPMYHNLRYYFLFYLEHRSKGVPVDLELRPTAQRELRKKMLQVSRNCYKHFGAINWGSIKQVDEVLKEKKGEGLPLSEKGNPTANKDNKDIIISQHEEMKHIYEYRTVRDQMTLLKDNKKSSFFFTPSLDKETSTVYPSSTFMSQNLLRFTYNSPSVGNALKSARSVVRKDGWVVVGADFTALELRKLYTVLAGPPFHRPDLLNSLLDGECPKQKTVDVFGRSNFFAKIPDSNLLHVAKTLNYAKTYGQGWKASLRILRQPESRRNEFLRLEKKRFPGLFEYHEYLKNNRMRGPFVVNDYGVKVMAKDHALINGVTQSDGILYSSMYIGLYHRYMQREFESNYRPILHCHDEVQALVNKRQKRIKERVQDCIQKVKYKFRITYGYDTHADLNVQIGDSWKESH